MKLGSLFFILVSCVYIHASQPKAINLVEPNSASEELLHPHIKENGKIPVCIDVTCLLQTNETAAASYIGFLAPLSYCKKVGHMPTSKDLFAALKGVPASTTLLTYNQELEMPLVFSSWLLSQTSNETIKKQCLDYLQSHKELSKIEVEVFTSILNMMLTPTSLIETQKIIPSTKQLLEALHATGNYELYLIGNWDKESAPALKDLLIEEKLFHLFKKCIFSHELKTLKPHKDFYQAVLKHIGRPAGDCFCLERESKMQQAAFECGFKVVKFFPKPKLLKEHASSVGLVLSV